VDVIESQAIIPRLASAQMVVIHTPG
jgi:hypothetical protein